MSTDSIMFHEEHPEFTLDNKQLIQSWLHKIALEEDYQISNISYIFLTDEDLLKINRNYLDHDYLTDIITFPLHEEGEPIEADIFISVDRVQDNAEEFEVDVQQEFLRVIAHGLLHLCGYGDETDEEKMVMREKEEEYIDLYSS